MQQNGPAGSGRVKKVEALRLLCGLVALGVPQPDRIRGQFDKAADEPH